MPLIEAFRSGQSQKKPETWADPVGGETWADPVGVHEKAPKSGPPSPRSPSLLGNCEAEMVGEVDELQTVPLLPGQQAEEAMRDRGAGRGLVVGNGCPRPSTSSRSPSVSSGMISGGPGKPSGSRPDSSTRRFWSSPTHFEGSWGVEAGRSTTRRNTVARWRQ